MKKKNNPVEIMAKSIIDKLKDGVVPWRRKFSSYGPARNYSTNAIYSGINFLILNFVCEHEFPLYIAKGQLRDMGGSIKKGAKAVWLFRYYSFKKEVDGEEQIIKGSKVFPVFNIEDTTLEWEHPTIQPIEHTPIEVFEDIIKAMEIPIGFHGGTPCYIPSQDRILMPSKGKYKEIIYWYKSLMHEYVHSTGHESRLKRPGIAEVDTTDLIKYGREELVAELGASYLLAEVGLDSSELFENTSAYLGGWIKTIEEDPYALMFAAPAAEQAVNYIMRKKEELIGLEVLEVAS